MEIPFFVVLVIVVLPLLGSLKAAYNLKRPSQLPERKPRLSFLPKYKTQFKMPSEVLQNADPVHALSKKLSPYGFRLSRSENEYIEFTKGSMLGEITFDGAKMKLKLKVLIPLTMQTTAFIRYSAFAGVLFDTGDLWKVTKEIKSKIE